MQNCVNKLANGIVVKGYYSNAAKFMQRILYEYGCLDGVLEYSVQNVDEYRSTIKFAKQYIRRSFYKEEKLYHIDLNGAFSASADGIPLTIEEGSDVNHKMVY